MTRQAFPTFRTVVLFSVLTLASATICAADRPRPQGPQRPNPRPVEPPRAAAPQRQVDHVDRIYSANSRAAAVQAEYERHRHVLENFRQMYQASAERCYREMQDCVLQTDPQAREACKNAALAEHEKVRKVVQEASTEENQIHSQNMASINQVWSGQAGWNPGAVAENRRQVQQPPPRAGRPQPPQRQAPPPSRPRPTT